MFNRFSSVVSKEVTSLFIHRRNGAILECVVDTSDLQRLQAFDHKWCAFWSETAKTWYVYCRAGEGRRMVMLHRFLLETPDHLHVDHQDHNGLNNRRNNIRNVTRSVNQLNNRKQINNTSGYRGVRWDKSRELWVATVKVQRKTRHLGRFEDIEEANRVVTNYRKVELGCLS